MAVVLENNGKREYQTLTNAYYFVAAALWYNWNAKNGWAKLFKFPKRFFMSLSWKKWPKTCKK